MKFMVPKGAERQYVLGRELDWLCKFADELPAGEIRDQVVERIADANEEYVLPL